LRRFQEGQPIRARPVGLGVQAWRWARRNPGWAAAVAAVATALLVIGVGGTRMTLDLRAKLWQSYLDRARAEVVSGRPGQRFGSLHALREAARIRVTPEVRDLALAALVLPDVEVAHHWDGWPDDTVTVAFDADLRQYARLDREGGVTICRLAEGVEEVTARLPPSGLGPSDGLWMSPDGGLVARWLAGERNNAGRLQVWRVNGITSELVLELEEAARVSANTLVFRPDSRQIAVIDLDGSVSVYEVANGRRVWHKALGMEGRSLAFHPWKNQLAVGCGAAVRRFDLEGGAEAPPVGPPQPRQDAERGRSSILSRIELRPLSAPPLSALGFLFILRGGCGRGRCRPG
jgi:hypothetical protein